MVGRTLTGALDGGTLEGLSFSSHWISVCEVCASVSRGACAGRRRGPDGRVQDATCSGRTHVGRALRVVCDGELGLRQRGVRRQCWWPCRSPLVACAAGLMRSRAASTHFLRPPWPETGRGARVDVRANDWREYALNNNSTLVETNEFRHRTRCVCSTCSMTSSRPGLHAR